MAGVKAKQLELVAKGDLISTDGAAGLGGEILSVGADTYVLSADSGETTGLKWIDPATLAGNDAQEQEEVTTEAITGTDTVMTDVLNATPVNNNSVRLFLNGVQQVQGAGKDYTVSGTAITWLASTGTAVDQETSDVLVAIYDS